MKTSVLITIVALIIGSKVVFAQNKTTPPATVKNVQQSDSIYYACVPCCQPCSVFTTDKPGECPHCGMTLEKKRYRVDARKERENLPINKGTCKPPKVKKK